MTDGESLKEGLGPHLRILARYKHLILAFCLSATLSSLGLTYVFSEKYLAYTTILYRPRDAVTFQPKEQEALGFPIPFVSYDSIGNTLEELATSDAVAQKVVQTLHLDQPKTKGPRAGLMGLFRDLKDTVKDWGGRVGRS